MLYWPSFIFFWIFYRIFLRLKIVGREHIPSKGGYLIASNHLSNLDPMLIGIAAGRKISFMAKSTLFKNFLFSFILRGVMAFPIKRESRDIGAIKEAIRRLKNSGGLVVFPQGTRRTSNIDTEGIKGGVGFLAAKANVPIIPALIQGSDKVLPPGSRFIRLSRVVVTFGSPISCLQGSSYEQITNEVMGVIKKLSLNPTSCQ